MSVKGLKIRNDLFLTEVLFTSDEHIEIYGCIVESKDNKEYVLNEAGLSNLISLYDLQMQNKEEVFIIMLNSNQDRMSCTQTPRSAFLRGRMSTTLETDMMLERFSEYNGMRFIGANAHMI